MGNGDVTWKRRAEDPLIDNRSVVDMDLLKSFIMEQNKELQEIINKKMQETVDDNKSNIQSLEVSIDKKLDSLAGYVDSKIEGVRTEFMATIKDFSDGFNGKIQKFSEDVEDRIDYLERQSKLCDVVVKNVPYRSDENMRDLVYDLCDAVAFKNVNAIKSAFRMSKQETKSNPIVMKFYDKQDKREFMSAYFRNQKLNLSDLGFKTKMRIVINEALTQKNSEIFKKAMQLKFNKVFASVSTRNGFVFYRLDQKSQPCKIPSLSSLNAFCSTGANANNNKSEYQPQKEKDVPNQTSQPSQGNEDSDQSMVTGK